MFQISQKFSKIVVNYSIFYDFLNSSVIFMHFLSLLVLLIFQNALEKSIKFKKKEKYITFLGSLRKSQEIEKFTTFFLKFCEIWKFFTIFWKLTLKKKYFFELCFQLHQTESWLEDEDLADAALEGFSFARQRDPVTDGIDIWDRYFYLKNQLNIVAFRRPLY